jgi:hypothetical protein
MPRESLGDLSGKPLRCKDRVDVALSASLQNLDPLPYRASRRPHKSRFAARDNGIIGIHENTRESSVRRNLT